MKIGFDAKRAFLNKSGLGNYSRDLISGILLAKPENKIHLFTPKLTSAWPDQRAGLSQDMENLEIHQPSKFGTLKFKSAWRRRGITKLIKKERLDIYHGLSHELPIGIEKLKTKGIVTIHDLIFEEFPQQYKRFDRSKYRSKIQHACSVADHIICVSMETARKLNLFYNIDLDKISVVPPSIHPSFFSPATAAFKLAVADKYQLPKQFLLSVGNFELRKQQKKFLKVLSLNPDLRIALVGKRNRYSRDLLKMADRLGLTDRLIMLHHVSLAELPAIYQLASAFIYASEYEGFGMPIAEAMASGCPVICPDISLYHEVTNEHAYFYQAGNWSDLNAAINSLSSDGLDPEKTALAKEKANDYSSESTASACLKIYSQLA